MRAIGLFGGTFDPIHYGHLRPLAETARSLNLEQVKIVPAAVPPHRQRPAASAQHRSAMVALAIRAWDFFELDEREILRSGPSYTVDTLESLRNELGQQTSIVLCMGADAFSSLDEWHEWSRIPELAHIAVMQRPGWLKKNLGTELRKFLDARRSLESKDISQQGAGLVWWQEVEEQNISATAIRAAIAEGRSVSGLMPEAVIDYIEENHLYRQ